MATGNPYHAKGSIGNLTFYRLGDKDVIRIKPAHVRNPRTKAQTNHRLKIKLASRLLKSIHSFIQIGYQETSLDYPANEARQYLMKNCFDITDNGPVIDYSKVIISRGSITKPEEIKFVADDDKFEITWKIPVKGDYTNGEDRLMIAMFMDQDIEGKSELVVSPARRKDGIVTANIPDHKAPVQIWIFFYNAEEAVGESRMKISDSVYVGAIE